MYSLELLFLMIICARSGITDQHQHYHRHTDKYPDIPEIGYLDLSKDPCEDFYQFTCGNFYKYHQIPPGGNYINHFSILGDDMIRIGNQILTTAVAQNDPVALKKVKAAYAACINSNWIDNDPILDVPELRIVDAWNGMPLISNDPTIEFSWNDIGKMSAQYGVPLIFNFMLYQQLDNTDGFFVMISLDPLKTVPNFVRPNSRRSYDEILEESFAKFGTESSTNSQPFDNFLQNLAKRIVQARNPFKSDLEIQKDLDRVTDFWQKLSKGGIIEANATIHPFTQPYPTLEDLQNWTYQHFGNIGLDWVEYFVNFLTIAGVKVDKNLITYPVSNTYIYGVLNLVRQTDPEVLKNFALLRVFTFLAPDSDQVTREAFNDYLRSENYTVYPRWEYCTRKILDDSNTASVDFAVAYDYQRYYFNKNKLQKATDMIKTLQATFQDTLTKSNWMDEKSRNFALLKAKNMLAMLAYPDFVEQKQQLDQFYRNIRICKWDHYSNTQKLRAFKQAYSFSRLAKPRTRTFWDRSVFETNAYYNRPDNRIILPLAMLNPVFFYGEKLLDFSRLGSIIGHEITHGFDSEGQKYNQDGVLTPWWTNDTFQAFEERTQCFIDQYNQYYIPEINAYVNGTSSLNENLADNGGIRQAYRAFFSLAHKLQSDAKSKFTLEQLFFIGYGTSWCSNETKTYMENYSKKYSPNRYRVNGPLANLKEFADAFHCPIGRKMNPVKKCSLW